MMGRSEMLKAVLVVAIPTLCGSLLAQQPSVTVPPSAAPRASRPQLKTLEDRKAEWYSEHHIILNVAVRDAAGNPVEGLSAKDMTLLDNGHVQPLQSFRALQGQHSLEPVHVLLVLDTLDASARELSDERKVLEAYLAREHGQLDYPTALAVVTDAGASVGEASQDGTVLLEQMKGLPLVSHMDEATGPPPAAVGRSNSPSYAAMQRESLNGERWHQLANRNRRFLTAVPALLRLATLEEDQPGRCVMIWLGQGWPLLTDREFMADSQHAMMSYFQSIVLLEHALRSAQVTVFNVASQRFADTAQNEYRNFVTDVPSPDHASAGDLSLQVLALQSGGAVVDGSAALKEEIEACLKRADSYYSISFDARAASSPDEYHSLQITVPGRSDVSVRTSTGYYNQP